MHNAIQVRHEAARGCGRRKTGGMHLVLHGRSAQCGKLPIPLTVCKCCGAGFKFSRAPQWIDIPEEIWRDIKCKKPSFANNSCKNCPLSAGYETGPALMIWVGEKYYPTPRSFELESEGQGISRRIKSVPKDFVVGETWVLLAHRKAVVTPNPPEIGVEPVLSPGIFTMFKPSAIEIVVTGDEPEEVIDGYLKRGLTPVIVKSEQLELEAEEDDE